jgi:hypothetical protein
MAERDKVIKSGQLTFPRLLFLAAIGAFVVGTVALGGIYLTIGYWALTLAICGLLYLIAIDYGIHMDKVDLTGSTVQPAAAAQVSAPVESKPLTAEARAKKRTSRAKRRR